MEKDSSSETKRLREAEKKRKEKRCAVTAEYYKKNRETINRKRREKRKERKQLKATHQNEIHEDSKVKPKKYDWKLYKQRQRANAKEHVTQHNRSEKGLCSSAAASAFPSRMSKKRNVDSVKSSLPKSPAKKVAVLAALIESPTARKGLERLGVVHSSEKDEEAETALAALRDANVAVTNTKAKRSNDARAATQTAIGFLCGEEIKKKRLKTKVAKLLRINRKRISNASNHRTKVLRSKESCWSFTERKTRSDAIPTEHRKLAHDFWASPEISRTMPNKKDIVRKRLAPKTYVSHPKQILEKTQTEAYHEFKTKYPEIKMGQRSFEKYKPFYIATPKSQDRITCCCRIHVETRMVFQSCMEFRRQLTQRPDEYIVYKHLSDLVNETLCSKSEGQDYHDMNCLQRNCEKCGIAALKVLDEEEDTSISAPLVKWRKFEYVVIGTNSNNSEKRKLMLVDKLTPPGELFSCLKTLVKTYASHQFRANWQNEQLHTLVASLPMGQVVAVHDYSENYTCTMQDQIQSLYFSQVQASIHVTILHRHALMSIDGTESTEDNPSIVTEHLFVISPDCKHDHHSVHSARKLMDGYLKQIGKPFSKIGNQSITKWAPCMQGTPS